MGLSSCGELSQNVFMQFFNRATTGSNFGQKKPQAKNIPKANQGPKPEAKKEAQPQQGAKKPETPRKRVPDEEWKLWQEFKKSRGLPKSIKHPHQA